MLTTAGALALVFPPVFGLVALVLLALIPAQRRAAMDQIVADHARPLAGAAIVAGLAALLVGLLAYATVGLDVAIYASADLVMAGYIAGTGWIIWREAAEVNVASAASRRSR